MKVKDMIEQLQQFDPELEVIGVGVVEQGRGYCGTVDPYLNVDLMTEEDDPIEIDGETITPSKWVRISIEGDEMWSN